MKSGTDFEKRAYGCVIGAFIGDSLGSFHEFTSKEQALK